MIRKLSLLALLGFGLALAGCSHLSGGGNGLHIDKPGYSR